MNTLYLDCFSGISGDMMVGALLDLKIMTVDQLQKELSKLSLDHAYTISAQPTQKNAIFATDFDVKILHDAKAHGSAEEHHHAHGRTMAMIEELIQESTLDMPVKTMALTIFSHIAKAEAKVHHKPVTDVHFHEVGAVDSIVDIVSVAVLMHALAVDKVICSSVSEGHGFIECQHGLMPVPVPAVSQMFATRAVPITNRDVDTELVTPTGAGILCALVDEFGNKPMFKTAIVGYGSGKKELETPNLLRIYYGACEEKTEQMMVVEANMDDMTGEDFGFLQEKLFEEGAADVFFTSIYMKKNRPATKISAICREDLLPMICQRIFDASSTIGLRYYPVTRQILSRREEVIDTRYGEVRVKISGDYGKEKVEPEYDDIHIIANNEDLPIMKVRREVQDAWFLENTRTDIR